MIRSDTWHQNVFHLIIFKFFDSVGLVVDVAVFTKPLVLQLIGALGKVARLALDVTLDALTSITKLESFNGLDGLVADITVGWYLKHVGLYIQLTY